MKAASGVFRVALVTLTAALAAQGLAEAAAAPRFAYVACGSSVAQFRVAADGKWTPLSP